MQIAPHVRRREVIISLFPLILSWFSGGNCPIMGTKALERLGTCCSGGNGATAHERHYMQGDHGIPGARTD